MMENKTKIDLKNKSVFITGAAGFIGSNLAKRLLSTVEGVKVVGLDNMNHYYDVRLKEARLNELERFENFSFVKGNLADKSVIEAIFEQYKPEIVVNLGAQAGVRYLEPMEMILTAKAAENQYVGVSCGKLDQSCEVLSKKNHLLYLDTKDDSYELIPTSEKMKPYKVAIQDTVKALHTD